MPDHLAEHGIAVAVGLGALSMALSFTLMKNCAVAELGLVRAMAMVCRVVLQAVAASSGMGAVGFCTMSA
jgi:hypothetical protein